MRKLKKRSQTDNDVQNYKQHGSDKQWKPLHQTNEKIKTCSKPLVHVCNSICNQRLQEIIILRQHRQRLEQLTTRYCSCQVTWVVKSSSGKTLWIDTTYRYVFIQFLNLHTPARIFSMLNVGSIRKKKKKDLITNTFLDP